MMSLTKAGAAIAALSLCVQPCLAADLVNNRTTSETRAAAFAGLQVRLPLGQKEAAKPTARLQLSAAHYGRERTGEYVQLRRTSGLEIGTGKSGKPALFVAGQDTAEMQNKLNASGSTKTLLIVGGVIIVAAVIVFATSSKVGDPAEWFPG